MQLEVAKQFLVDLLIKDAKYLEKQEDTPFEISKKIDYYQTIVKSFTERVQVKGGYMENGKVIKI